MDAHLLSAWNWDPSIVGSIAAFALAYGIDAVARTSGTEPSPAIHGERHPVSGWQIISFYVGLLVLLLALASPLDLLADHYLFTAHMLQHVLLLLVVPPLLLWGMPEATLQAIVRTVAARSVLRKLAGPLSAFVLYSAFMWVWHAPTLYEAALGNELIHVGEHLCFLISATLFWWPLVRPTTSFGTMPELIRIVYLFGAALSTTLLAALLTFATSVLYPTYALGPPYSAVRDALGMSPLVDQEVGGLLMWIGGALWYLGAAFIIFFRWFDGPVPGEPRPLHRGDAKNAEAEAAGTLEPVAPNLRGVL
ncbi:MAG TPA: cytochrome c oxidase assembly protein [Chloroflexota bacterium]|nr:cytochrome c oxidase assembly protein [Chloroflexota bacterium]